MWKLWALQGGGYRKCFYEDSKAGFSYSIDVQRGELVCRLKKTCTYFDRDQTVLWFDSFSMLPTLNLAHPVVWGEDKKKIALLKVRMPIARVFVEHRSDTVGLKCS